MKIRKTTTCHTCRARKLACDGKKPACSQCAFSGKACAGYEYDLIFRAPIVPGQPAKPRRQSTSKSTCASKKRKPKEGQDIQSPTFKDDLALSAPKPGSIPQALGWPLLDVISLVVQNFSPLEVWDQDFSRHHGPATSSPQRICGAWVESLPALAREGLADDFLAPAVKTLAVAILARGQDGRAPVSDALNAHTSALAALRAGLIVDGVDMKVRSNMLAAATMCLYLSEMMLPTSTANGSVHAKGIEDLLRLQTPDFYSSGIAHQLFVGFRPVLLIHAFLAHQNTFLSDASWLTVPFQICGPSYLQHLLSSVTGLPSILGTIDQMPSALTSAGAVPAREAFERLSMILDRLAETQKMLESDDIEWSPTHLTNEHEIIQFPNITAANLFTHLWAFRLACIVYIKRLAALFPWLLLEASNDLDIEAIVAREGECILLILRSIEFLMKEDFRLYGAASVILPLKSASDALSGRSRDNMEEKLLHHWHERVTGFVSGKGYHFVA